VARAIDAFDNATVEKEVLARGASMFSGEILPGDFVYVPVGALHGARNFGGSGAERLTAAISANFLDAEHVEQVKEHYCLKSMGRGQSICNRVLESRGGQFLRTISDRRKEDIFSAASRTYKFWNWHLYSFFDTFCEKNSAKNCPDVTEKCDSVRDEL